MRDSQSSTLGHAKIGIVIFLILAFAVFFALFLSSEIRSPATSEIEAKKVSDISIEIGSDSRVPFSPDGELVEGKVRSKKVREGAHSCEASGLSRYDTLISIYCSQCNDPGTSVIHFFDWKSGTLQTTERVLHKALITLPAGFNRLIVQPSIPHVIVIRDIVSEAREGETVDITLSHGSTLYGYLVDMEERPIERANVTCKISIPPPSAQYACEVFAHGREFELREKPLIPGTFRLRRIGGSGLVEAISVDPLGGLCADKVEPARHDVAGFPLEKAHRFRARVDDQRRHPGKVEEVVLYEHVVA